MRRLLAVGLSLVAAGSASAAAAPVAGPISSPVKRPRGVVVLVHGGGWSGPNQQRQRALDAWPGAAFRTSRWNTISIDYAAGQAGLASVAEQLRAALAQAPHGRLCVYGESAGIHLSLLAAADLPQVRCIIGLGAPTDLERWRNDAVLAGNAQWVSNWSQTAEPAFGPNPDRRWEPVAVAWRIAARVLLVGQADDHVLPVRAQMGAFALAHPMTELMVTEAGSVPYLHGSFSPASQSRLLARMRAFLRGA